VKIQVEVLCIVTLCTVVVGYQRLELEIVMEISALRV